MKRAVAMAEAQAAAVNSEPGQVQVKKPKVDPSDMLPIPEGRGGFKKFEQVQMMLNHM